MGVNGLPHILNPNTKRITINNAQISLFSLDYFHKLEELDLASNKITVLEFNEITRNNNLRLLNTSHNNINELKDSQVVSTLNEIQQNDDSQDKDKMSNFKALKKLPKINVVELILSHNQLTILKNYTFLRWHKLLRLDLSFNSLVSIESESLSGLSKLEYINLRRNQLTQIPTQALYSTTRTLTFSTYSTDPQSALLKVIDLSENAYTSIAADSFGMLERAQELYLDSCSIQSIDDLAFKGLHTLYLLSLNNNNLTEVPSESFRYLRLLRSLSINGNNFSNLPPGSFSSLSNLEELQINNGSFTELLAGTFEGTRALRRLYLGYNRNLTRIDPGTFDDLKKLAYLSLYSNSLTTLPNDFNQSQNPLAILDLRENRWLCGCDLKWLTKWLKKFNETVVTIHSPIEVNLQTSGPQHERDDIQLLLKDFSFTNELFNLTCTGPPALAGKAVASLPENKLECMTPSSDLNLQIGFGSLFLVTFVLTTVCLVNFCRNQKHLFGVLKENLAQNRISMKPLYAQSQHKNGDVEIFKNEAQQLDCADYEPIDYQQEPVYTVPEHQFAYFGTQRTHQL